jgi:ketosteroid isomerase-like protein
MKNLIFSLFVLFIILVSCQKREAKMNENSLYPEEQEKVKQTLIHIFDLAKAKELDSVESYHLYGPKFTKFDDGEQPDRQDAETAKKAERELFNAVSGFTYTLDDLKADVFEDAAIATFIINVAFKMGDMSGTAKSRATIVFVKIGEDWKITHEHFSTFVPPPTPAAGK